MRLVLVALLLLAGTALAESFNVTVTFSALASGLEDGRTNVDYEIPEDVWRDLKSFGVTPTLLVFGHRADDDTRAFNYALPLHKRAGRVTAPAFDWTGMDAYELEIGGWNKNYFVNLMRVGDDEPRKALRWNITAPAPAPAAEAPRPVAVDPRVTTRCHEEFKYIDPGFVRRCADYFVGVDGSGALESIASCKSTQARIGPGAIEQCLKRAAGR